MACPNPSTLESFCVGFQLQNYCSNDDGTFPEARVTVRIINPTGGVICDPTSGAMLVGDVVYDSMTAGPIDPQTGLGTSMFPEGNDGCLCTCPLWANIAGDPDQALQPGGTSYAVSVTVGGELVGGQPFIIQLDADADYSEDLIDGPCGPCIDIKALIDPLPTLPPTSSFCDAVLNCLPPETPWTGIQGAGIVITAGDNAGGPGGNGHQPTIAIDDNYILGLTIDNCAEVLACLGPIGSSDSTVTVTGDYTAGWDLTLDPAAICQIVNDNCPETLTSISGLDGTGSFEYLDENGASTTVTVLSADAGNLITQGADGGLFVDCAAVLSCLGPIGSADGSVTVTGDYSAGWDLSVTETVLVVTTDGTSVGVAQSGTNDHIVDVTLLGDATPDGPNLLEIAPNGGLAISCETIQDCVGQALAAVDGITYDDAGNAINVTIVDSNGVPLVPTADGTYMLPPAGSSDVGQAVVTNTTDYVSNVEGTDTAGGVTSADVLTRLDDCQGNPIDTSASRFLTIEQGHAPNVASVADLTSCGVDLDCAPPAPACPIDGMMTTTQNGYGTIMWEWRGGWLPIMVSPFADSTFTQGAVTNYVDADLLTINGAGNAWSEVETIEHTVTNDDCVPWCVNFRARNHTQAAMLFGSRAEIRMTNSAGNTVPSWDGGPFHNYDYRGIPGGGVVRNAYGDMYRWNRNKQILQPGDTMTAGVVVEIRVPQYVSNPNAAVTIGNFSITSDIWRSLEC